ncbi:hypothetical protein MPNT_60094 [Candidatus Methylacidithermus pantelleriae]|uniref:Uncharacterized protein n=1 Tax=Candidatus Methylacidithermus pantelleriae TaxID=2744239 RepID=A0A8J2BLR1_9BACT|nr:hypothetical protein MPNT_60094 [Candidatus Methylacidithermus pantelleriae]
MGRKSEGMRAKSPEGTGRWESSYEIHPTGMNAIERGIIHGIAAPTLHRWKKCWSFTHGRVECWCQDVGPGMMSAF